MDVNKEVETDFCGKVLKNIITKEDTELPKNKVLDGRLTKR